MRNRDVIVKFGAVPVPNGYEIVWLADHEMYYVHRLSDNSHSGPYACRFQARFAALRDCSRSGTTAPEFQD